MLKAFLVNDIFYENHCILNSGKVNRCSEMVLTHQLFINKEYIVFISNGYVSNKIVDVEKNNKIVDVEKNNVSCCDMDDVKL